METSEPALAAPWERVGEDMYELRTKLFDLLIKNQPRYPGDQSPWGAFLRPPGGGTGRVVPIGAFSSTAGEVLDDAEAWLVEQILDLAEKLGLDGEEDEAPPKYLVFPEITKLTLTQVGSLALLEGSNDG